MTHPQMLLTHHPFNKDSSFLCHPCVFELIIVKDTQEPKFSI